MTTSPQPPSTLWQRAKGWAGPAVFGILFFGLLVISDRISDSTGRLVLKSIGVLVLILLALYNFLVNHLGKWMLGLDQPGASTFKLPPASAEKLNGQPAPSDLPDLRRLRRRSLFWITIAGVSGIVSFPGIVAAEYFHIYLINDPVIGPVMVIALVIFGPSALIAYRLTRVFHLELRKLTALQTSQDSRGPQLESSQLPVLYLRSFDDDIKAAKRRGSWTEEEHLVQMLALIGPVIAIGRPGEKLPQLGARRLYVSDEEWQGTVENLIKRSRLVAIRTGRSTGLLWEFQKCLELLRPDQLLLVVSGEAALDAMLPGIGAAPSTRVRLGRGSIGAIRAFVIFRKNWTPSIVRVKRGMFWCYTKRVDNSYIAPRLAYTLRPLFEQLGVAWPKPAFSGGKLVQSICLAFVLFACSTGVIALMLSK
jgi:hypothetical protein